MFVYAVSVKIIGSKEWTFKKTFLAKNDKEKNETREKAEGYAQAFLRHHKIYKRYEKARVEEYSNCSTVFETSQK